MRKFYRYTDEQHIEVVTAADGKRDSQIKIPVADVQALVDSGDAVIYDTHAELDEVVTYIARRRNTYPEVEEQLDMQYHDAVDGTTTWQDAVKAVKDANPKPE
tara:strand:- start:8 stop:316 length:309 start_codon:yes stop_codon:yes gene_type:complete